MAGSNYVAYNLAQTRTDAEKLQARNNIGAASLSSLAASFESRAPSYNWSAGEVCTYGGKLWMFDSNHSGAWTGADAHEIVIMDAVSALSLSYGQGLQLNGSTLSANVGEGLGFDSQGKIIAEKYEDDFIDITNEWTFKNNFRLFYDGSSPGTGNSIQILYSKTQKVCKFIGSGRIVKPSSLESLWNVFLSYEGNRFWTSNDTADISLYPTWAVAAGVTLFQTTNSNGESLNTMCRSMYVGAPTTLSKTRGLAFTLLNSDSNAYGIYLGNSILNVVPRN